MTLVLGDRSRFAAEVGEPGPLCRVDLWAADRWLTCDDNAAYVPQFRRDVGDTLTRLVSGGGSPLPFPGLSAETTHRRLVRTTDDGADGELRGRFHALRWGPTTDNVTAHLFREKERLLITLEFWREEHLYRHPDDVGAVYVVEIAVDEFAGILEGILAALGPAHA
ncbi:hypothetical protein [Streptomyces sp. NPDC047972]|uniref:hypothetical protein n=1 Tax=Streptomyces sp. NPDC047972 TaxID=3365493 RepID=UPI0037148A13